MSDNRQRERAVDHMLRRGAAAPRWPASSAACVDGEMLAAWSSGALAADAAARVEEHLADCARCHAMLAAFARTEPAAAAPLPWWRGARVRWLVPLATAATVAAIWVATPQRADLPPVARQESSGSQPPRQTAHYAEKPPPGDATLSPSGAAASSAPPAESPSAAPDLKGDAPQQRASGASARAREGDRRAESLAATARPPESTPSASAAPAAPAPSARAEGAADTSAEAPQQQLARRASGEIASPDGTTRWRIVGGQVQRSTTQGWVPIALPAMSISAGHAPTASVAWFVGNAGAVFVTIDDTRFEQVPFASSADLIAVVAVDARAATVTTADGRRFRTPDRGATWIELP